jgi:hypothetical protein
MVSSISSKPAIVRYLSEGRLRTFKLLIRERSLPSPAVVFLEIHNFRRRQCVRYALVANNCRRKGQLQPLDNSVVPLWMTFAHQKVLNTILRGVHWGNKINLQNLDGLATSTEGKGKIFHCQQGAFKFSRPL